MRSVYALSSSHLRYDSRVKAMEIDEKPTEDYNDIGGLDKQIEELVEAIVLPMTHPERFKALGIKPPKGIRTDMESPANDGFRLSHVRTTGNGQDFACACLCCSNTSHVFEVGSSSVGSGILLEWRGVRSSGVDVYW